MPAGSLEKLKVAVLYGADAVYLGTPDLSLRTKSDFSLEDVIEGVAFAHQNGVRVYLTLNLFAHNKDVAKLDTFIDTVKTVQPDGLIIADPGVFQYVRERAPGIPLHVSTQANVCSSLSVRFWQSQGADLVVLAREVSFEELTEIRRDCPDVRLEAFVYDLFRSLLIVQFYVRTRSEPGKLCEQLPLELQIAPAFERWHGAGARHRRFESRDVRIPVGGRSSARRIDADRRGHSRLLHLE